jgi:hypothetical protein
MPENQANDQVNVQHPEKVDVLRAANVPAKRERRRNNLQSHFSNSRRGVQ